MPNAAQTEAHRFIRSEIVRLRGPQSHVPLSLDQVTPLADEGDHAIFRVNGARVIVKTSGKVDDKGLPDCPTYASGLLSGRFLPAIAADLLRPGNPHKPFLANRSHTPDSFVEYLQHGAFSKNVAPHTAGTGVTGFAYPQRVATTDTLSRTPSPVRTVMMLRSYFEPDGQQRALEAYGKFARGKDWSIAHKMDLYRETRCAFDPTVSVEVAFRSFRRIYDALAGDWQVFRPSSPSACWPPRQIYETIRKEFAQFAWGGTASLPNFMSSGMREALLSSLTKMEGIKPKMGYPVMAVSKFLHFFDPALFPIYDNEVIENRVLRRFRNDFKIFCSASNLPYDAGDSALFLRNYVCWGGSLVAAAHPRFMATFLGWLDRQPGGRVAKTPFDASSLYATAFEFTAIGAAKAEES